MRTGRPKVELLLTGEERSQLQPFARSRSLPVALSTRARIVFSSADGEPNNVIAERLALTKATLHIQRIDHFVVTHNENCHPLGWTATADSILEKLHRLCSRISGHGIESGKRFNYHTRVPAHPHGLLWTHQVDYTTRGINLYRLIRQCDLFQGIRGFRTCMNRFMD